MTKEDILIAIEKDEWMMKILSLVAKLDLPDWWIGAGFVRNKVWDILHEQKSTKKNYDIDVIYFNKTDFIEDENSYSTEIENKYQEILKQKMPELKWSVTNQARMHILHNRNTPYKNSIEAISDWVETATCIGVTLRNGKLFLAAPNGIDDLINLILRPTKNFDDGRVMSQRIKSKKWLKIWPKLRLG